MQVQIYRLVRVNLLKKITVLWFFLLIAKHQMRLSDTNSVTCLTKKLSTFYFSTIYDSRKLILIWIEIRKVMSCKCSIMVYEPIVIWGFSVQLSSTCHSRCVFNITKHNFKDSELRRKISTQEIMYGFSAQ